MVRKEQTKEKLIDVKTENSTYQLDVTNMTWCRLATNGIESDEPLRTLDGSMYEFGEIIIGKPLIIIGPPMSGNGVRLIHTSNVLDVTYGWKKENK